MTGSATQSGQASTPPAGETGAAAAAGDQVQSTVLTAEAEKPGDAAKPADGAAAAAKPGEDGAKPADGAKPDDKGAAKAPEKYADFTIPDGVTIDAKAVEAFTPVLKKHNLSQEAAQELVNVYAQNMAASSATYVEQLKDDNFALEQVGFVLGHQRDVWSKALKTDSEIGGKDYDKNVKTAQRAIARFGSPQFKAVLERTGLGNHPEFVRFCLKAGHVVSEDTTALGAGAGQGGKKAAAEVFYGGDQAAG